MIPSLWAYGTCLLLIAAAGTVRVVQARVAWARWHREQVAGWLATSEAAYEAAVRAARADAELVAALREARAVGRLSDVAALRPWHGPASDRHR